MPNKGQPLRGDGDPITKLLHDGLVELDGEDEDGRLLWRLTPAGLAHAEQARRTR